MGKEILPFGVIGIEKKKKKEFYMNPIFKKCVDI